MHLLDGGIRVWCQHQRKRAGLTEQGRWPPKKADIDITYRTLSLVMVLQEAGRVPVRLFQDMCLRESRHGFKASNKRSQMAMYDGQPCHDPAPTATHLWRRSC
jgi:hypothetical protein